MMNMPALADQMTLDPGYQEPAIIREIGSSSAFSPALTQRRTSTAYHCPTPNDAEDERGASAPSTLTELVVRIVEPRRAVSAELAQKAKAAKVVYQAYSVRIDALKSAAALDGFSLNKASERDFWSFIKFSPFIKKGSLVLMDNGNLRATWKDGEGNHIGLQFLGNRLIQYVIFKRRAGGHISRVAGCDMQKGVERQIQTFDLKLLMYA